MRIRSLVGITATQVLLLVALVAPAPAAAATADPVLLIHGYRGTPTSFDEMAAWLTAQGREAVALTLPGQDNVVNARFIRDYIASRPEWTSVDIVAHSMGGLSSRYLLKSLGGTRVQAYVSLGTPQTGVYSACLLPQTNGGQMCPSSSFLRNLNNGDDTPGSFAYATIYSTSDEIVPYSRSRLDGGACHYQVSGLRHNDLLHSPTVTFPLILASLDDVTPAAGCSPGGAYRT